MPTKPTMLTMSTMVTKLTIQAGVTGAFWGRTPQPIACAPHATNVPPPQQGLCPKRK